jgi:hypothetical protein
MVHVLLTPSRGRRARGGSRRSSQAGQTYRLPTKINRINLSGYQIETSYPLGKLDAGSTYLQTYTRHSVTAKAIKGPLRRLAGRDIQIHRAAGIPRHAASRVA